MKSHRSKMKWGITSFELSGDQLAYHCLEALSDQMYWVGFSNSMSGRYLQETLVLPKSLERARGSIGFFGFLLKWFWVRKMVREVGDQLLLKNLIGCVLVDFPSFHLRLLKYLKKHQPQLKVVYISPPKTWASRPGRLRIIRKYVDQLVTLFEFENVYFRNQGLPCVRLQAPWLAERSSVAFWHPEEAKKRPTTFLSQVVVYPGSRDQEIKMHMGKVLTALELLVKQGRSVEAYISLPKNLWDVYVSKNKGSVSFHPFSEEALPSQLKQDVTTVIWACSGTMTDKIATWGLPMIVMYGLDRVSYWLLRSVYRSYLALPNLSLNKEVYPELVGPQFTPEALVKAHLNLMSMDRQQEYKTLSQSYLLKQQQGKAWVEGLTQVFQKFKVAPQVQK